MREIYSLGRVAGFSAYELYVRQNEYEDPGSIPASEREWLASTIAMGSSMLCRIEADMSHDPEDDWVLEVPFPENTRLGAANTIVGSFFRGEAEYYNGWAQRVTDYGELVCNTAENHPDAEVTNASNMPIQDVTNWPTELKEELAQYLKIVDGVVLQPGRWPDSENDCISKAELKETSKFCLLGSPFVQLLEVLLALMAAQLLLLLKMVIFWVLVNIPGRIKSFSLFLLLMLHTLQQVLISVSSLPVQQNGEQTIQSQLI